MRWFGHVERHEPDNMTRKMTSCMKEKGKRTPSPNVEQKYSDCTGWTWIPSRMSRSTGWPRIPHKSRLTALTWFHAGSFTSWIWISSKKSRFTGRTWIPSESLVSPAEPEFSPGSRKHRVDLNFPEEHANQRLDLNPSRKIRVMAIKVRISWHYLTRGADPWDSTFRIYK